MTSLMQAYFKSLQFQQIILNKMTQLFVSPSNNPNMYNDIQTSINQLKNNINTEITQISSFPGITNESTDTKNNPNSNSNETNEIKER